MPTDCVLVFLSCENKNVPKVSSPVPNRPKRILKCSDITQSTWHTERLRSLGEDSSSPTILLNWGIPVSYFREFWDPRRRPRNGTPEEVSVALLNWTKKFRTSFQRDTLIFNRLFLKPTFSEIKSLVKHLVRL